MIKGESLNIKYPNSQRDFIYIDDVIDIIEKVTFSSQKIDSIDVGSSKPTSILEVVNEISISWKLNEIKVDQNKDKEEIL